MKKPTKENALRSASLKKETKKKISSEEKDESVAGPQRPRTADQEEKGLFSKNDSHYQRKNYMKAG